jgi:hypothetical protein
MGGNTAFSGLFDVESLEVREFEVEGRPKFDWSMKEGRGGTFSSLADDGRLIFGVLGLREPAGEDRFRRPSFIGLGSAAVGSGRLPGVNSVRVEVPLSRLVPADREVVAAFLLIDPELFTLAELSFFLTGITTASPPSPNRENLGTGSVMDIQFSLGSRDIEGGHG